jgi:hypothetical protein
LKRLVTIGTITAETEIETEDGKKSVAGKVKGLKFSNAPVSPNPEDNTYNLNDLYSVTSDNTVSVPVPPLTAPSQENQSTANPSYPTITSYSNSQPTARSTHRIQQSEEESSIWDYIFLNPKFTVFVTSTLISLLWRLSVIIFVVSILFSVFMIGNSCRILVTMPSIKQLENEKENPPKKIKDLITKKSNLIKEKEKLEEELKFWKGDKNLLQSINKKITDIDNQMFAFSNRIDQIDREISEHEPSKNKAKNAIYEGLGLLIIAPFCLLLIRLSFELIFVFFRIENHLKLIEEKT